MPRADDTLDDDDKEALRAFLQRQHDQHADDDHDDILTRWPLQKLLDATEDFLFDAHDKNGDGDKDEVEILIECCLGLMDEVQRRFFPAGWDSDGDDDDEPEPGAPDDGPVEATQAGEGGA
jgi:hypothetical protein